MKYVLTIFVLTVILLVSNCNAQTDRWIYVTTNSDYTTYYDVETIKYNGNEITVNLKSIYSDDSKEFWDLKYSILKSVFYCGEYRFKNISVTEYYKRGGANTIPINNYIDVIPETTGEDIYKFFCK
ncbi:MAG: surface-adhesin E family protein [Ignavibacteria bacterium]